MSNIGFTFTLVIIALTSLISYRALNDRASFERFKHYPYAEKRNKEWYRLLTGGFIHGSYLHLIINMYVLFTFGEAVEKFLFHELYGTGIGSLVFVIMYLLNIVAASLPTYAKHKNNPSFASVGASGAVSGIVFIFIVWRPWHPLQFIFLPMIDIPAILLGVGYLIYSSWASNKTNTRIDHVAHFYGAIFGIAFVWLTKPGMIFHFFDQLISIF